MGVPNQFVEFVDLVSRMRKAQSDYFRLKSRDNLQAAMKLERDVDQVIACTGRPYMSQMRQGASRSDS